MRSLCVAPCLVVLLSLLLVRGSAVGAAAQAFDVNDSFDGTVIDATRWYVHGGAAVAAGGKATMTLPASGTNVGADLTARWKLRGPFEYQVDYELLEWPADGYAALGLLAGLPSDTWSNWSVQRASIDAGGPFEQVYLADHVPPPGDTDFAYGLSSTADTAGTLRLARDENSVLTASIRPAGAAGWVTIYSAPMSAEEVQPILACWTDGAARAAVAFDSFRVTGGEVVATIPTIEGGKVGARRERGVDATLPQDSALAASSPGAARAMPAPASAIPLTVGVLPFGADDQKLASQVSDIIAADLTQDSRISLVERTRLGEVLSELGLSTSGVGDPETAQKVGFLAGARVLVWGQLSIIGQQAVATGRVVGVETGRVFAEQARGPRDGDLVPIIDRLAGLLAARIVSARSALVATEDQDSLHANLNALAERLRGRPLPKVAVVVEGEVSGSSLASALETELELWLVRCGVTVVKAPDDARAARGRPEKAAPRAGRAAWLLVAEASVAPGDSYGPLRVARYRLQVRVVNRRTGEVMAVARRAGECAEMTLESASVHGLQRAATSIAAELIPKLAGAPAASLAAPAAATVDGTPPPDVIPDGDATSRGRAGIVLSRGESVSPNLAVR